MTYAINLYFDQGAENYIKNIWSRLERLEKGKCLTCVNGRPHITLAIYEDFDLELAKGRLKSLKDFPAFSLKFHQIGIFPHHKGAIFLTPNLTDNLFQIHRQVHEFFQDFAGQGWEYYKPQAWYPHCTLAMETPREHIPSVLEQILQGFQPLEVLVKSIGIVSLEPINYLFEMDFHQS